jgi:hypothetical protein
MLVFSFKNETFYFPLHQLLTCLPPGLFHVSSSTYRLAKKPFLGLLVLTLFLLYSPLVSSFPFYLYCRSTLSCLFFRDLLAPVYSSWFPPLLGLNLHKSPPLRLTLFPISIQHFPACFIPVSWRLRQRIPPKRLHLSNKLHGITTHSHHREKLKSRT